MAFEALSGCSVTEPTPFRPLMKSFYVCLALFGVCLILFLALCRPRPVLEKNV